MQTGTLVRRSLLHYRGIHLAVIAGVATAVGVLAGSLAVGDSVRGSLRDLVLGRLGATRSVISSATLFREKLTDSFAGSCPMIALEGVTSDQEDKIRANGVAVYGVDDRFWRFHNRNVPEAGAQLSEPLARKLGLKAGDTVLVRVEQFSDIPREFLHGRRENSGRTIRLKVGVVLSAHDLGEFTLRPRQGDVLAVFVPLRRLQRDLKVEGRINTLLLKDDAVSSEALRHAITLDDVGINLRHLNDGDLSLERRSTLIDDAIAQPAREVAQAMALKTTSFFTYLVNIVQIGDHQLPYSLVTAEQNAPSDGLTLNDWAAQDLGVSKPGATATLEFYVWKSTGGLATQRAEVPVTGIVPLSAGDRDMAPEFPGISDSPHLADWDPPFPIDIKRVRQKDEQYWDRYRATPKAFLPLQKGQELWGSRFGNLTSIRIHGAGNSADEFGKKLLDKLDPTKLGLAAYPVRAQGLSAAQGNTDFGEYFSYFSFFLVISALMLAGLFFKLGIEQRSKEIGILRTLGFPPRQIRWLYLRQGVVLAVAGGFIGMIAAQIYTRLVLLGLRTFWNGAVGTTLLTLHARPASLADGFAGGLLISLAVILWTLRGTGRETPRSLVAGGRRIGKASWLTVIIPAALAAGLLGASAAGKMDQAGGFFGSASLLLIALLRLQWIWLARGTAKPASAVSLGFRNASFHPGRSILCIALIASAAFIVIAMDAFRQGPPERPAYPVIAESQLPIYDRSELPARSQAFRLHPGDDASCLNLYEPRNPRVIGAPADFLKETRFKFEEAVSKTDNPWTLLDTDGGNGVIPAIADANSMTYVLHRKLGDEIVLPSGQKLRLVAALHDSIFQGELIVSDKNFVKAFPDDQGFRFFLIDAEPFDIPKLDAQFSEFGFDATSTADRLASFHRVENTYLSTFQALGGLGLILGTFGLAAVLLRNVMEQRRELALLRAIGYRPRDLSVMVLAENVVLLIGGLATGAITALLAVLPALGSHGSGHVSVWSWSVLLPAVLVTGLAASLVAVFAAIRLPVLDTLRAE